MLSNHFHVINPPHFLLCSAKHLPLLNILIVNLSHHGVELFLFSQFVYEKCSAFCAIWKRRLLTFIITYPQQYSEQVNTKDNVDTRVFFCYCRRSQSGCLLIGEKCLSLSVSSTHKKLLISSSVPSSSVLHENILCCYTIIDKKEKEVKDSRSKLQ